MRSTEAADGGTASPPPQRHARVWLDPETWRSRLLAEVDEASLTALDDWIVRGRSLVARRRDSGSEACFVGVVLPPRHGQRRVPLVVDPRAVVRVAPPLLLGDAVDAAPADWRVALADLVQRGRDAGTAFRVYGSLAWQAVSGETYVGPMSDVDLLWQARDVDHVRRVLRLLTTWEAEHGLRADGELSLANGDGVAWRELTGSARRVLVKHQDRVSLQPSPLLLANDPVRDPSPHESA